MSNDGNSASSKKSVSHRKAAMTPVRWSLTMIVLATVSILLIRWAHVLSGTPLTSRLPLIWSQIALAPMFLLAFLRWRNHLKSHQRTVSSFLRMCLFLDFVGLWASACIYLALSAFGTLIHSLLPGSLSHTNICSQSSSPPFLSSLSCLALYDVCLCITPSLSTFLFLIRSEETLSIHSKRGALLHFLYDVPAVTIIFIFKILRYPFNSLATIIPHQTHRIISHPLFSKGETATKNGVSSSGSSEEVAVSFIVLGAAPLLSYEFAHLRDLGVKCVVNLCHEFPFLNSKYKQYGMEVLYRPTLDMSAPKESDIEGAVNFIHAFVQRTHKTSEDVLRNRVFIHCKCGMGRSATVTLAYLASFGGYTLDEAAVLIKDARQDVALDIKHYLSLNTFLDKFHKNRQSEVH